MSDHAIPEKRPGFWRRFGPELVMYGMVILLGLLAGVLCGGEASPAATAPKIINDPANAVAANKAQVQTIIDTWLSSPFWAWLTGAGLLVLAIARRVAPGLWGIAAGAAYELLAPARQREETRKAEALAGWADLAIRQIEDTDDAGTLQGFKQGMGGKMSPAMEAALQAVVAAHKTEKNTQA